MQVEVTDADRAAACDFADWHEGARQFTQEDVYQLARCIATHREAARIEGIRLGLEAAAGVCDAQKQVFMSEEYAVGQPMSSFMERFACGCCSDAIRAIDPAVIGGAGVPKEITPTPALS